VKSLDPIDKVTIVGLKVIAFDHLYSIYIEISLRISQNRKKILKQGGRRTNLRPLIQFPRELRQKSKGMGKSTHAPKGHPMRNTASLSKRKHSDSLVVYMQDPEAS
jgi:hypothetical protein